MNTLTKISICAMALCAFALNSPAQVGYPPDGSSLIWSGRGAANTTNISSFITSAKYGPARVEFIDYQQRDLGGTLKFYSAGSAITVTQALAVSLSNLLVSATNTLVAGDTIVIHSVANDTYQRAKIHLLVSATSIIITNAPTATAKTDFALVNGDKIYRMTLAGSVAVGASGASGTNGVSYPSTTGAPAVWNAQEGRPALVELDGGATGLSLLNVVSGSYYYRFR